MNKWILVLVAVFGFAAASSISANTPEKMEMLAGKQPLENTQSYFILSDGSYWKVMGFAKRWRTMTEWWNNAELAPENYNCVPNDWVLGSQIEVYSKYQHLNISEADASNQADLKQCTHLFVNTRTGQILFAMALDPIDCLTQLFKDAHQEGYNSGFVKGKLTSYQDAEEVYKKGIIEGEKVGYAKGHHNVQEAYRNGVSEGEKNAAAQNSLKEQELYLQGFNDGEKTAIRSFPLQGAFTKNDEVSQSVSEAEEAGYVKGFQDGLNDPVR